MKRFDDAMDALSWLFDTKTMGTVFAHIVDIKGGGEALVRIQELASRRDREDATAAELADQWLALQACMGPPFIRDLLQSGEFREVCPFATGTPQPPPMDDELTVWSGPKGKRVVAEKQGKHYIFFAK